MSNPWLPKFDEKYYVVALDGSCQGRVYKDTEQDKVFVKGSYNYFKTREAAETFGREWRNHMANMFLDALREAHAEQVDADMTEQKEAVGLTNE